jgi:glycosyltransferase involved in cell wall biosynthesis
MSGKPTVSVIIPTFNRPQLLLRAVNSVLKQTYSKFEIIIIDDCSDVDIQSKIEKLADDRIKYVRHSKRLGGASARNTGIQSASGEYIALLDDDDEWMSSKLEKQVDRLYNSPPGIGIIYCGYRAVFNGTTLYEVFPKLKGNLTDFALKKCPLGSPTPLIRKRCFNESGLLDKALPSCQDWDLWIRFSMKYDFDYIPEVLAIYHIYGDQISVNITNKIRARKRILEKYMPELEKRKEVLSWHLRRLGSLCCFSNRSNEGCKYLIDSIRVYPANVGSYAHLALFFISKALHKKVIERYGVKRAGNLMLFD